MPRPCRILFAGAKYHVTQRGNGRRRIFVDERDRDRFLAQLRHAVEADGVRLFAYVLMPNHYHLFVETARGNLPGFLQRLNTAYAMYHRYRHRAPGHCFQGRPGARLVSEGSYCLRVTRYIHLNPVKISQAREWTGRQRLAFLRAFPWSSFRGYAGLAPADDLVDYRWLRAMGQGSDRKNRAAYLRFVAEHLATDDAELADLMQKEPYAVGGEDFVRAVRDQLVERRHTAGPFDGVAWPSPPRPDLREMIQEVAKELELTPADLSRDERGRRAGPEKTLAVEILCRLGGVSQREVARALALASESGITHARRRLADRCAQDTALAAQLERTVQKIKSRFKL